VRRGVPVVKARAVQCGGRVGESKALLRARDARPATACFARRVSRAFPPMPPQLLFDISGIDLNNVIYDKKAILEVNPQRGTFEQLDGIVYADADLGRIIGFKDVRADEFWVKDHIPGRPLLPGVLMIEAAAQVSGFFTAKFVGWGGFIGFGGATDIRFRQPVTPGSRLYLITQKFAERHRRIESKVQGLVNGAIVFEATIIGTQLG
jgi:3-hydroxyacyl-[acyl-carrier-protein] dehydratase